MTTKRKWIQRHAKTEILQAKELRDRGLDLAHALAQVAARERELDQVRSRLASVDYLWADATQTAARWKAKAEAPLWRIALDRLRRKLGRNS